jgi:hypothetical protein
LKDGTDEIVTDMVVVHNGYEYKPTSSTGGTQLFSFDENGNTCPVSTTSNIIQIPESWASSQTGKPLNFQDLESYNYIFSNPDGGTSGHLIGS